MTRNFQSTSDLNDEKDRDERRTHSYEDVAALPIVIARLCDFECNRCTRSPIVTTSPMVIALHSTASTVTRGDKNRGFVACSTVPL